MPEFHKNICLLGNGFYYFCSNRTVHLVIQKKTPLVNNLQHEAAILNHTKLIKERKTNRSLFLQPIRVMTILFKTEKSEREGISRNRYHII